MCTPRSELDDLKEHLPDALIEGVLGDERVTFMNRIARLVFGYEPEDVAGLHARDLFVENDYARARALMQETLARGTAGGGAYRRTGHQDLREFRLRRKDGSVFPAETPSSITLDAAHRPVGVRTIVRDTSRRKELEVRLEEMSFRDPLTGCFDRRYIERKRTELERPTATWVCLLFDLTSFKAITTPTGTRRATACCRPSPTSSRRPAGTRAGGPEAGAPSTPRGGGTAPRW